MEVASVVERSRTTLPVPEVEAMLVATTRSPWRPQV